MNRQINITDIPKDIDYEGYLWMSDSKSPTALKAIKLRSLNLNKSEPEKSVIFDDISDLSNPFIVEGQLYCEAENKSYSIKYVDGKHHVIEYDLNNLPEDWIFDKVKDKREFISNRMKAKILKFRQYWKPEVDEFCEDMKVLQPAAFVFVGFEYESKIKEEK